LQAVWVTSSPLSEPQRQLMQRVFGAPVYDQYGCGEIFWLACECEQQHGLHLMHGHRHVEALDADGQSCGLDMEGELHITDLVNRVFPIIRYANGDRGSLLSAPCACGRALPLLAPVKGRVSDMLRLPGGLRVAGDYLTTLFDHAPEAVEAFQVRQDRTGAVRLCVVPASGADANAVIEGVRQTLAGKTGQEVQLEMVDHIGHERGKTRFIVSEYEA
jgi:phenylacetate-CoA ligase